MNPVEEKILDFFKRDTRNSKAGEGFTFPPDDKDDFKYQGKIPKTIKPRKRVDKPLGTLWRMADKHFKLHVEDTMVKNVEEKYLVNEMILAVHSGPQKKRDTRFEDSVDQYIDEFRSSFTNFLDDRTLLAKSGKYSADIRRFIRATENFIRSEHNRAQE